MPRKCRAIILKVLFGIFTLGGKWTCYNCTYINQSGKAKCGACSAPNPSAGPKGGIAIFDVFYLACIHDIIAFDTYDDLVNITKKLNTDVVSLKVSDIICISYKFYRYSQ